MPDPIRPQVVGIDLPTGNDPVSIRRRIEAMEQLLERSFTIPGVNFPIGVLIYWFTTNLWSMGQQFYVIRRMPAPGSEAEAALKARRAKRAGRRCSTAQPNPC